MTEATDSRLVMARARPETVFSRVLVGMDGSAESSEAARQAALLLEDEGELTLLAAYDIASALVGGTGAGVPAYLDEDLQRERAVKALQGAREGIPKERAARERLVRGCSWEELIREAEREQGTLIAVGSHGLGRRAGSSSARRRRRWCIKRPARCWSHATLAGSSPAGSWSASTARPSRRRPTRRRGAWRSASAPSSGRLRPKAARPSTGLASGRSSTVCTRNRRRSRCRHSWPRPATPTSWSSAAGACTASRRSGRSPSVLLIGPTARC